MEVSLEVYRDIVRNVAHRSDIAALCGVSRAFRHAAERALYNTLTVSDEDRRPSTTLARSPRIAALVVALTVQIRRRRQDDEEEHDDGDDQSESDASGDGVRTTTSRRSTLEGGASTPLPLDNYWASLAGALRNTTGLRHLTVDIADPADSANAWVLDGSLFQLRTFHCDFDWDRALLAFLSSQSALHDLSLRDYRDLDTSDVSSPPISTEDPLRSKTPIISGAASDTLEIPPDTQDTRPSRSLPSPSLHILATLECTFSEAVVALAPGRPLARLKTCFSRPDSAGKRAELLALLAALRLSMRPICALDMADTLYTESSSIELLHRVAHTQATSRELRYLGTLALPVGGRKRLHFYGLLMRLKLLRCLEVDVSGWSPPPSSSPAFRALAAELRLYCPNVATVVFVREFERTVVSTAANGVLRIDEDASPELFWREI